MKICFIHSQNITLTEEQSEALKDIGVKFDEFELPRLDTGITVYGSKAMPEDQMIMGDICFPASDFHSHMMESLKNRGHSITEVFFDEADRIMGRVIDPGDFFMLDEVPTDVFPMKSIKSADLLTEWHKEDRDRPKGISDSYWNILKQEKKKGRKKR